MLATFKHILFFVLFCLTSISTFAQYYTSGVDPLHMHWVRISLSQYRIDADTSALDWAAEALRSLAVSYDLQNSDYPRVKPRSFDMILHSRSAVSNGMVSWAPRRMELFPYNNAQSDYVVWQRHLLTHEYRHIIQTESVNVGFTRVLGYIFGQQWMGLTLGLFAPRWLLEGDAVRAETIYTPGGRGRNASWIQQMRSIVLERKIPSYSQAYFGSYRVNVPDYYHMGYYVTSAVADTFGHKVWASVFDNIGRRPFTFVPVNNSLRHSIGMRRFATYRWAMNSWRATWQKEMEQRKADSNIEPLAIAKSDYEEIVAAQPYSDGYVVYASSPDYISYFAFIDSLGNRKKLLTPYYRTEEIFALRSDSLVWTEQRPHACWTHASRNVLRAKNLRTGKTCTIASDANYHSPALSPTTLRLAAVRQRTDLRHSIVVFNVDGKPDNVLSLPVNYQVSNVVWQDEQNLICVVVSDSGKCIVRLPLSSPQKLTALTPLLQTNVRSPYIADDKLYFSADSATFADIYSLSINGAQSVLRRYVTSRNGADYPLIPADSSLVFSSYSSAGYMLSRIDAPQSSVVDTFAHTSFKVDKPVSQYSSKRIGIGSVHLLPNVHSWGPVVVDVDDVGLSPGLSVCSQNTHGSVSVQAGMNFGHDTEDERYFATIKWNWLLPELSFKGKWGHQDFAYSYSVVDTVADYNYVVQSTLNLDDRQYLTDIEASISLPLTHNSGAWLRGLRPQLLTKWERASSMDYTIRYDYYRLSQQPSTHSPSSSRGQTTYPTSQTVKYSTEKSKYVCLSPSLYMYLLRRQAERDIDYRFGLSFNMVYDLATLNTNYGSMLTTYTKLYLPGFGRHHNFAFSLWTQRKWVGSSYVTNSGNIAYYTLSDCVGAPTGLKRLSNTKNLLFRGEYTLPLMCPDWQVGPIAYVKRLYSTLWFDYSSSVLWTGVSTLGRVNRQTMGVKIMTDIHLLALPFPIKTGVCIAYRPDFSDVKFSGLLSISFQ